MDIDGVEPKKGQTNNRECDMSLRSLIEEMGMDINASENKSKKGKKNNNILWRFIAKPTDRKLTCVKNIFLQRLFIVQAIYIGKEKDYD